jgi:hypothetical protein
VTHVIIVAAAHWFLIALGTRASADDSDRAAVEAKSGVDTSNDWHKAINQRLRRRIVLGSLHNHENPQKRMKDVVLTVEEL